MKKKILITFAALTGLILLSACGAGDKQVTAGGSTALQPLVEQASIDFMKQNPDDIIMVQGGGSGVGLAQVAAGSFQIGSSDIFAEEKTGIDASKITDHKVAVVGFAPIVNENLKVSNLTDQQLTDIFTGKITNWKEVGGQDEKITVIGRTAGSGTRVNFDKYGLNGATEINGPTLDASGSVVQLVGQTPGAISYVSFSYINKPNVKPLKVNNVTPNDDNVKINKWKIWSYEHMYTNNSKENKVEEKFINYVTNDSKTLKKLGYISVSDMKVDRDAHGNIKKLN
ncbi:MULTISPECIES: phosphate ABC transporter substrate-binding protein PstS family protein [unclassified Lactococcus]|uniref:phosphate ABC transporter substrate-binding protein PstS family protein n=1 Tax=unclassified Lactococcus TaxID=2643510 RepID=UPI0011C887EA|nr:MULTISPECIES: phosphate ABC transporter substrate-binding protein PstS family protein [unclassified Lactococcus]MQW22462.1 phosphate ABC transporter substrate-binding protein PstS family protein [Lactococcus sp. dk101]TXK45490.1 phosphate ABC transporter substrate-binding protein PstS family protein [Lactococcus sp. dk310]TXK51823.1 phosphate ABC transporter substrate-binding protein PstS family protein [Lactococcus sp. dk322]